MFPALCKKKVKVRYYSGARAGIAAVAHYGITVTLTLSFIVGDGYGATILYVMK